MQRILRLTNPLPLAVLFTACCILTGRAVAQKEMIIVGTAHNDLVLQEEKNKDLSTLYYGPRLSNPKEYAEMPGLYHPSSSPTGAGSDPTGLFRSAYTPSGSRNLLEPAITVTHADGDNSLDLQYISHETHKVDGDGDISETSILLRDPVYDFEVTLYYRSYYNEDVIEQWSMIRHKEKGNVVLHKFASADLTLRAGSYWLRQYHGDWAMEMQPEESRLTHGIKTLDSKLGTRTDLYQPPVFMISLDKPATEDEGTVICGGVEWSGNYKVDLELDPQDNLRVIAGMNNYASSYSLAPGEAFTTPAFVYVLSDKGKGEASRRLHRWARDYKLVDGKGSRLTLLNNWESTYFDFNEEKLAGLLKDAKKLGVDLFLLDDGWFANKYPRNGDHAGLGDWQPNRSKLPNGIASLVKEARTDSVRFGIWVEPEMVNPKSELYEQHPEWIVKEPKREEHYFRNQLVLDLTNPKVQDFVFGVIDGLFTQNPDLAYIKWDCNAVIFNARSATLKDQDHFYVDYVRGLYKVLARLRARYPKVPMMLCSGGGGRVDYGALQYFTEYWPSDNTDPMERIFMQWEYSYFYPAIASANHVTDWGKQPLKFRTDVAMMGRLGFDIVISKLDPNDLGYVQSAVKTYNDIKGIIWQGDQYRLSDPATSSVASMEYLDTTKNKGIIFNYLVNYRYEAGSKLPIRLKGLDPAKNYRLKELDLYPGTVSPIVGEKIYSGEFLMTAGFNPDVDIKRTSVVLSLEAVR